MSICKNKRKKLEKIDKGKNKILDLTLTKMLSNIKFEPLLTFYYLHLFLGRVVKIFSFENVDKPFTVEEAQKYCMSAVSIIFNITSDSHFNLFL
jgi:hypothetical protein